MSALCEGVDCRQIGALCIISLNIRMTGDTQPPPPARARRVAEGLLPLYMSIRSKRPTGSGVRRRLLWRVYIVERGYIRDPARPISLSRLLHVLQATLRVDTESRPQQHTWNSEFFVLFPLRNNCCT